jgi:hypothetical protein
VSQIIKSIWMRFRSGMSAMVGHKLDPRTIEETIRRKLPSGTHKSEVLRVVRSMRPFHCSEVGDKVMARWLEETGDLVRSWDIVVVFSFDERELLLSYYQSESDFIDYDLIAARRS